MKTIKTNFSLKNINAFGFDIKANFFASINNEDDLIYLINNPDIYKLNKLIVGQGTNMLFKGDFNGIVIQPNIDKITITHENNNNIYIQVGAGVCWDDFVNWSVENNFYGIENLSLIPGNVGAAPIQNIGAYGVEVKDVITKIHYLDIIDKKFKYIYNKDCKFGYRDSIFKNEFKNKVIITNVEFCLSKVPVANVKYGDVKQECELLGGITLQNIRKAIINIRNNKLPNHKVIGNAGSFFKNPIVKTKFAEQLKIKYPEMPIYKIDDKMSKIPAGWLIDKCNLKGYTLKNAAVHNKQALVIINKTGNANGQEILNLANHIVNTVFEKFNIKLEKEVNVIE